jgi:hypothetical protein
LITKQPDFLTNNPDSGNDILLQVKKVASSFLIKKTAILIKNASFQAA